MASLLLFTNFTFIMNNRAGLYGATRLAVCQLAISMMTGPAVFVSYFAIFHVCLCHFYQSPLSLIKRDRITFLIDPSISLKALPSTLSNDSVWVNVSIMGVSSPKDNDWIGVFTVNKNSTEVDPRKHAPVKFKYLASNDTYLKTGEANLPFYLINMREDYQFQLFSGGLDKPVLTSVSNRVTVLNPNYPMQGHIALTHNASEIVLQWVTKNVTDPEVMWGETSRKYSYSSKKVNTTTYNASDLCGSPATDYGWMDPGSIHTVIMDRLNPLTRYYYRFGSASYGWSKEFSFLSPPVTGPKSSVRMIAYGDLGHGELDQSLQIEKLEQASLNTTRLVKSEINETQLLIHIGDLSYAVGFNAQWDEYYTEIQPVAASVPYMVCDGNHETDWPNTTSYFTGPDSGGECNVPYILRNPMPREKPSTPWYGFDFGCIHVVMISNEHDFTPGSEQYRFLINHLASVNRSITPWLIFSGHRPMYVDSSQNEGPDSMQAVARLLREHLEPLLEKYKVDIAFWGHHHTYQRTCQVRNGTCLDGEPMHIIIGMAGRPLLPDFVDVAPPYFKYLDDKHYGYTRLTVNETTLVFQYVRNDDHNVHDEVVFRKNNMITTVDMHNNASMYCASICFLVIVLISQLLNV